MNRKVNVYSFNEECYVYLNDYKQLEKENQELKKQLNKYKNRCINRLNNQLAENVEPDLEEFYLAEIEKKANDYDKLLVYQTEYIKFLKDMIVGFNKRIAYKKHHNWNYSNDVIQLVVYKKCLNQMNKIFKKEV